MPIKRMSVTQFFAEVDLMAQRSAYMILSEVQAAAAVRTPVDISNLINSAYAPRIREEGGVFVGTTGYTANYAAAVHEKPGTLKGLPRRKNDPSRGLFWDPMGEPRFLRKGADEVEPKVVDILRAAYEA